MIISIADRKAYLLNEMGAELHKVLEEMRNDHSIHDLLRVRSDMQTTDGADQNLKLREAIAVASASRFLDLIDRKNFLLQKIAHLEGICNK